MIRARFLYCDKLISVFEMRGHADSGEYGQDIVCSAVSVLAINTVNSLEKLANANLNIVSDDENGGLLEVHVSENFLSNESVKLLLASLKLGLEDVEKMYGDFIKIENN